MSTHNLPPQTSSFVGRTQEIAIIEAQLSDENCHLLTLAGAGGMGKTRLAIEVARRQHVHFADGVVFVALQALSSSYSILETIANLLGKQLQSGTAPEEQILYVLRDKHMLLVMDNFEHLLDSADLCSRIVHVAPKVKILVTSREALNLQVEWLHQVRGMHYPQAIHEDAQDFSAIKLFCERARQVSSRFAFDDEHECVLRICRLVQGMPLALELAASWLRRLRCADIADEIEHNLDFLATDSQGVADRHCSIRAVFEHSWQLLGDHEKAVYMRLSVFRGGFTREAAKQVAGASLRLLSDLVDKSLVQVLPDGRYDVHELLRQYAEEKLQEQDDTEDLRNAHCAYYLHFLHTLEADIKGRQQVEALNDIERDMENIRLAWSRACDRRYYDLMDISLECLWLFYFIRSQWLECYTQFQYAIDALAPQASETPHSVWHRLRLRETGSTSFTTSAEHIEQAESKLVIARTLDDPREEAYCLLNLSGLMSRNPNGEPALPYAEQALVIFQEMGDEFGICRALTRVAYSYWDMGDIDSCLRLLWQSVELGHKIGDKSLVAVTLSLLGYTTYEYLGNYKESETYWQAAYRIRLELKVVDGIAMNAAFMSHAAILRGDIPKARALATEALAVGNDYGWKQFMPKALSTLGLIAIAEEKYDEARRLFNENHAYGCFVTERFLTPVGLALACCGRDDYTSAKGYLLEALRQIDELYTPIFLTLLLPPAALMLAHEGDARAASELVGLAFNYPDSLVKMMERWSLISNLIARLQQALGRDTYFASVGEGSKHDLERVARTLLRRFDTPHEAQPIQAANQALTDPLTERELEVLQLLAEGLSNREIAHELVVSLGTVKKHNNNIFGKLQATSRTQAVAQGREFGLLG